MTTTHILSFLVLIVGFYMSWNIGANDVSNAMGTAVGSKSLTLRKAVILAAILEFSGAFFLGGTVSETLQQGIIQLDSFRSDPKNLVLGMFSALLATSIWLQVASYFGWPVSTTHAIVGAILGFGWLIGGNSAIHWNEVLGIALSWVISPVVSAIFSFMVFSFLQKKILFSLEPVNATRKILPMIVFFVIFVFFITLTFDGLENLGIPISINYVLLIAFMMGLLAFAIAKICLHLKKETKGFSHLSMASSHPMQQYSLDKALKHLDQLKFTLEGKIASKIEDTIDELKHLKTSLLQQEIKPQVQEEYAVVEKMFAYLQILSACFVAFAHGANDVANAIGPVASVLEIIKHPYDFATTAQISPWLLAIGGFGIVIGLATWGWRVIETIGKKITELTPTRGFSAEFGAAVTILIASKMGFPISTTHCIVGSVLGVGMAKGIMAINIKVLKEIVMSWVITIPASALCSIFIYFVLKAFTYNWVIF